MILKAVFAILMAVLALVAVPFGANRLWAWALLAVTVGVLLIATAAVAAVNPAALPVPWRNYRLPAVGYFAVLAWTLIQASTITPAVLHHPLWAEAAAVLGRPLEGAISLDPAETLSEATRFLAYGGVFWLAMQFGGRDGRARAMLWVIVVAVAANAAYGLLVHASGARSVLWFPKWAYQNVVTGTFVNRNHFATYLGLALVVAMTFLIEELRRVSAGISLRTIAGLVRVSEAMSAKLFVLVGLVALLGTAAILTGSRGGIAAIGAGLAALLAGIALSSKVSGGRVARLGIVLACGALLALLVSGEILVQRLQGGEGIHERLALYGATAEAVADAPVMGTGPGTFADLFMAYRPESIGVTRLRLWYDHAHNTYLEVALESGLPTLAVLLLMAAHALRVYARGARARRHNDLLPAIGIGATALVAFHALFDFSLEIPAVAVTYLAIAGIAYAQSFGHAERTASSGTDGNAVPPAGHRPVRPVS